jgi:hypothetical protein
MIAPAIREWVRNKLASVVRLTTIRGRDAKGIYSCDGYRHPDDPESVVVAKRAQHYGFCSEPPSDGTCVAVAVAVGGGASNRVAVAEYSTNTPEIEEGEVVLWTKAGQRVLLNKDGDVVVYPATGRNVILGSASGGDCDPVVTKSELNSLLSSLKTAYNSHTHPVPVGPGTSSAPTATITSLSVNASPNVFARKP